MKNLTSLRFLNAFVLMVSFVFAAPVMADTDRLRVYTENFRPYQYEDENGELKGFGVELIRAMFEKAGVGFHDSIRLAVWDSVYKKTLEQDDAAILLTVRNRKREDMFQWVGPLAPREMWLYKLAKRSDIQLASIEDAKRYRVGTYKSAQSDYLEELGFPSLDIVLKEELNLKKLLAERVDLIPSLEILMSSKLSAMQLPFDTVEKLVILDNRFDYYLALNKGVDKQIVTNLQSALDELKANGFYAQLEQKYLSGENE